MPNEMPWLGIFEVRHELEPHSNVADGFDHSIDHELARAAETGSLEELQRQLRSWLGAALTAQNPKGLVGLDIHARGRYIEQLLDAWLQQRTPSPRRQAPSAGAADETHERMQWAVRITTKSGAALSRPYGTRQEAAEHIARIRAARPDDEANGRAAELVWRRVHPWCTGEPAA